MKGGCLRSDEDSCISGPDGSCELLESWTVCCSSQQPVPFLYSSRIERVLLLFSEEKHLIWRQVVWCPSIKCSSSQYIEKLMQFMESVCVFVCVCGGGGGGGNGV